MSCYTCVAMLMMLRSTMRKSFLFNSNSCRFKKLALKYHPLKNPTHMRMYLPKFQLICEAYEVLSNSQLKAIYETYGEEVLRQGILGPDGGMLVYLSNVISVVKRGGYVY